MKENNAHQFLSDWSGEQPMQEKTTTKKEELTAIYFIDGQTVKNPHPSGKLRVAVACHVLRAILSAYKYFTILS